MKAPMRHSFILSLLLASSFWNCAAQSASKGFDEALAITCEFGKAAPKGSNELSKVFFQNGFKFPEKERQSITLKIRNQLKIPVYSLGLKSNPFNIRNAYKILKKF